MSGGALWIILIAAGIAAVVGFAHLGKRRLTLGRAPMEMTAIHAPVSGQVSLEVLRDVLNEIGQAYSLDPRLIRPEDSLESLLRADSWTLDAGAETLNRWLVKNGLGDQPISAKTVLDLARLVEDRRQRVK